MKNISQAKILSMPVNFPMPAMRQAAEDNLSVAIEAKRRLLARLNSIRMIRKATLAKFAAKEV